MCNNVCHIFRNVNLCIKESECCVKLNVYCIASHESSNVHSDLNDQHCYVLASADQLLCKIGG